jgi:hypothetical protein
MKNLALILCLLFVPFTAPSYSNPALIWVGQYLLGKAVDKIWEPATGAPDVNKLDGRLKDVEALLEGSLRRPIAELREQITPETTRVQYEAYVKAAMSSLERQVAKNTEDIEKLQDRVTALEGSHRGLQGDLRRYLESHPNGTQPSSGSSPRRMQPQAPPTQAYALRNDGSTLHVHVNGRPTVIWSDGSVDVWADQNNRHVVLKAGQHLNFPTQQGSHHPFFTAFNQMTASRGFPMATATPNIHGPRLSRSGRNVATG